jgi:hypothetical protein
MVIVVAFVLALVRWWWHPFLVHLSQETGTSNAASRAYDFWSGFGSDLGEATLLAGLAAAYRHHSCHVERCPRLGKPVDGTPYLACPKHHPDHHGSKRSVSLHIIHRAHADAQNSKEAA